MALHRLDRAAVAITAAGSLQSFVRGNASSQIHVAVLGVSIALVTTSGPSQPLTAQTNISVNNHGTTQTAVVTLAAPPTLDTVPPFYDESGSYTITASLVDVQNGSTGFKIEQRFEPGSTVHVEV